MIQISNLQFRYHEGDFALRIPELSVAPSSQVAVIGPSGSGKTTLLNLISGVTTPERGLIRVGDTEVSTLSDAARRAFRIRNIGMVFQEFELLDYLNVLDNILLPCRVSGALVLDSSVRSRAAELARQVGLGDKLRRHVDRLSHGERQRVGICRALLPRPTLLLADEPTGNLDPLNRDHVLDILQNYATGHKATLLTVTHDRDLLGRFGSVIDLSQLRPATGAGQAPREPAT